LPFTIYHSPFTIFEFLTEDTLYIERTDSAELLDIKRGDWPLDKVKSEAERLFQLAQEAYVRSLYLPNPPATARSAFA